MLTILQDGKKYIDFSAMYLILITLTLLLHKNCYKFV